MSVFPALGPLLAIAAGALAVILAEAFFKRENKDHLAFLSLAVLLVSGWLAVRLWGRNAEAFGGTLRFDDAAVFLTLLLLAGTAFVVLMGMRHIVRQRMNDGEFYGLLLLAAAGLVIMVSSGNFVAVFLGLEVLSVSSYALAGLKRGDERSTEAAAKYFLIGSFAAAFIVFGLALLFGGSGTLELTEIAAAGTIPLLALAGLALVLGGFAFKLALVPFHMWQPDVYEGAPTPVTAFFAFGPKAAGFLVLLRLLLPYWQSGFKKEAVFSVLWAVAAATMLVSSLAALRQRNVKRMLAYSSIAHAGYLLIAVLSKDASGLLFYLANYLFLSMGAFGVLAALGRDGVERTNLEDFAGLGARFPWMGGLFAVFVFGLAGFPPTGGFLAKFYVFSAAVREGHTALVLIAVLSSLISVYYYLRVVVFMYMRRSEGEEAAVDFENPPLLLVLFLCLYGVLQLGIFPSYILTFVRRAAESLF
ncbi:MAG: NADH-quinone oxidoreductase subunit N [Candidatus Aminicenantes bacterium]|nr:NADH-quinone oxidoreductase subunit N [Candidatus Aminicenantes bacterium]